MKKEATTRKCLVTHKVKDVSDLIRIAKTKDNEFYINSNHQGRGAYISKDISNPEIILKKRLLNRSFKTEVPKEVYEEIIKLIRGEKDER